MKHQRQSEANRRYGRCLCGAVQVDIPKNATDLGVCHCTMCRRWTGGPLLEIGCGADINITGQDAICVYDSSPWAERAFCTKCGTNLFYRLKETQEHQVLAGLFDDVADLDMVLQVFVDEKPDYYDFSQETKKMTGAEVYEMVMSQNAET